MAALVLDERLRKQAYIRNGSKRLNAQRHLGQEKARSFSPTIIDCINK